MGLKRKVLPLSLVHVLAVVLLHGDDDAVAGSDIVEQEVTVGIKSLVAERFGNGEFSAIHRRSRRCRGYRGDMANGTADLGEERFASLGGAVAACRASREG